MQEEIDIEKLANVLNSTGQRGNDKFVKMLWKNQPTEVQSQLLSLLNAETRQVIEQSLDASEPEL